QLRTELHLRRHLLEQPPSYAAYLRHGHGRDALGQPSPVVLAVVVSVYRRLDGRESFRRGAHCAIRRGAADGRDRVHRAPASNHWRAGAELDPEKSRRARLEGQDVAGTLSPCDRCYPFFSLDRPGSPRGGGAHLVDSGPTYPKRTGTEW